MDYIAIIHKGADSDYGVSFPDFPGCITAGRNLDEAKNMAGEALGGHVEEMLAAGETIPAASSLDTVMADPDFQDGVAFLVGIKARVRTLRVNITVDEADLREIDQRARAQGLSRSGFLVYQALASSPKSEAYETGYVAAMEAIREFATRPAATATAAPRRQRRAQAQPAPRRTRRGDNARRIAQAMMTLPNHTGPAAEIKRALAEKGHDLPYTSIRHSLDQLQARGEASVAEDGRTWSYTAPN